MFCRGQHNIIIAKLQSYSNLKKQILRDIWLHLARKPGEGDVLRCAGHQVYRVVNYLANLPEGGGLVWCVSLLFPSSLNDLAGMPEGGCLAWSSSLNSLLSITWQANLRREVGYGAAQNKFQNKSKVGFPFYDLITMWSTWHTYLEGEDVMVVEYLLKQLG